jgi:photosystem II stability/assembly factor-like uncharacterized protein
MQKWLRVALVGLIGLGWCRDGFANGRFPRADQLLIDPSDPSHLVLRATFGLLLSSDHGASWGWVCESALGFQGDLDPALAIFENGTVAAGFARDLRVSRAGGCDWSSPFGSGSKEYLLDATVDPGDGASALFVSRRQDASQQAHLLLANQDLSTSPLGSPLGDDLSPLTLEVAPSAPDRIYVTAIASDLTSQLLRSDDRGETWERLPIEPHPALPAFIAAVDPANPDRLYLRLDDSTTDYLLVSDDAGTSFDQAFSLDTELLGFALSPDGQRVALGGPGKGLFLADASDLEFQPSPAPIANLSCLKWTQDALFACGNETADGFTLATSSDGGENFAPLFHLHDLTPLSCNADTDVGARCEAAWPALAKRLGITEPAAPPPAEERSGCGLARSRRGGASPLLALWLGWLLRRRSRASRC